MRYFGYYSSTQELPNNHTDKLTLYMIGKYRKYYSIFENRSTNTLRIVGGSEPIRITLDYYEKKEANKAAITDYKDDEMHYRLLRKLSEQLPDNSAIIFKCMGDLGRTADYAFMAYKKLVEAGIQLKFINCPPLNSEAFLTAGKALDESLISVLIRQIRLELKEEDELKEINDSLSSLSREEKKELHINTSDISLRTE